MYADADSYGRDRVCVCQASAGNHKWYLWLQNFYVTLLIILAVMGKGDTVIGCVTGIWIGLQCVVMIATIPVVERALRRRFDRNGNLR